MRERTVVIRRPVRRTGSNWIPWVVLLAIVVIAAIVIWALVANNGNDVPAVQGAAFPLLG
jgi:hypothetical protein